LNLSCRNCGAALLEAYCGRCGQKHDPTIHRLRHFSAEAFESITHADSRLWRTLRLLLFRPGALTCEFFAGRRASYLPPVRLYLVVSLLFFLLAGWSAVESQFVRFDAPSSEPTQWCNRFEYRGPRPEVILPRLRARCLRIMNDGGRQLNVVFLQNFPRALFVMLPLMAFVMLLLYWRPRRYYVEHLLLLLHNHTALFVMASLAAPLQWIGSAAAWVNALMAIIFFYVAWYLFRSMRVYYGQSIRRTASKYLVLGTAYALVGTLALILTAIYSATTV
jgi:hypothetical protein